MTAFELKRVFLFQSVHQLAEMMLPVIKGTYLLLASFFVMIATVFPFQAGGYSKDITGKFYLLIVKKSKRKLVKIICSVQLATKKAWKPLCNLQAEFLPSWETASLLFSVYNLFFGVTENRSVRDCQTIITCVIKVIKDMMVLETGSCLVKYGKERKISLTFFLSYKPVNFKFVRYDLLQKYCNE